MTDQPEQLMYQGREVSMTVTEQAAMRNKLLAYTLLYRSSPATATAAVWTWARQHVLMTLALVAMVVLGGTGVSAHMAGPNDTLYGFRLHVNDRIEMALAFSEDAQFDVELQQIQRELDAEDGAFEESLADVEQDEDLEEKSDDSDRKDQKESDADDEQDKDFDNEDGDKVEGDVELEAELRLLERELQREASANIELEI